MLKRNRESGEVVVEASIVVTIVVIFISVFLYIGMILYQQSLVSIMANQTASNIAQVYSNSIKDPFTGYVDSDSVYQSITYSSMKTDAYVDVLTQKANTLAYYRLKSSRILTTGNPNVEVDIVKKPNELLKSQIVVTIRDKYQLPLVSFFGADNELEFSATGRADCVDILEYLNGVEAIGDPEHSSVTYLPDSDTCLVQFFDNRVNNKLLATVPVLKGKSIITSNYYTHSTMPSNPTSDKFDFTGWVVSDGSEFFATTEVSGNTTVYGSWECTVKFEPEGGTVSPTSKKVQVWSVTDFPTPSRSGWTFLGWFTQQNGSGVQYFSNTTTITDNLTLYASWRCNHNYVVESQTAGNCKTKAHIKYKCTQCGDVYEEDGGYGSHNYQNAGVGGYWCYETYYIQRCSICGDEIHTLARGLGEHDYSARCNAWHGVKKGTFRCSVYGYVAGPDKCQTTNEYHVTCRYCGKIVAENKIVHGKVVIQYAYWCGIHGKGAHPTGCNCNGDIWSWS